MPVPAVIATAAENYRFNSRLLVKMVSDLSPEEWLRRPDENCNHMAWIVGHLAYCRGRVLHFMGTEWSGHRLGMFARGKQVLKTPPTLARVAAHAWNESGQLWRPHSKRYRRICWRSLRQRACPASTAKISGIVSFMAIHETYHLGQASYLRGWLGHKGLMG